MRYVTYNSGANRQNGPSADLAKAFNYSMCENFEHKFVNPHQL